MSKKLSTSMFKQALLKGQSSKVDGPAPIKRAVEDNESVKRRKIADADEEDDLNTTPQHQHELILHHPELATVWEDLKEKMDTAIIEPIEHPSYITVPLLPSQRVGVAWMMRQEKNPDFQGGVLAEEIGKKIQTITLLLSDNTKPNLVVAPAAAIIQWSSEIEKHTASNAKVHIYQGAKLASTRAELESYDIVITTYSVLASAYGYQIIGGVQEGQLGVTKTTSICHCIEWHRVVIDNAKIMEDHMDMTARAVFALKSKHKWALTTMPLQECADELYSLVKLIKADPFTFFYCKDCPCKIPNWEFFDNGGVCPNCAHEATDHICWWKDVDKLQLLQHMTLRRFNTTTVPHHQ